MDIDNAMQVGMIREHLKEISEAFKTQNEILKEILSALKSKGGNYRGGKSSGTSEKAQTIQLELADCRDFKQWKSGNGYNFTANTGDGEEIRCGAKNEVDIVEADAPIVEGAFNGDGENRIFWIEKLVSIEKQKKVKLEYESVKKLDRQQVRTPAPIPQDDIDEEIPF